MKQIRSPVESTGGSGGSTVAPSSRGMKERIDASDLATLGSDRSTCIESRPRDDPMPESWNSVLASAGIRVSGNSATVVCRNCAILLNLSQLAEPTFSIICTEAGRNLSLSLRQ